MIIDILFAVAIVGLSTGLSIASAKAIDARTRVNELEIRVDQLEEMVENLMPK